VCTVLDLKIERMESSRKAKNQKPVTKQQVRQMMDSRLISLVEAKYKDVDIIGTPINDVGLVSSLSDIAQGINANQRIGDSVDIESLECRWSLLVGDATNVARIILFQWHNNTVPIAGNILQNTGVDYVTSQYQGASQDSYTILYDSGPVGLATNWNPLFCGSVKLNTKDIASDAKSTGRVCQKFPSGFKKTIQYNPTFTTGFDKLWSFFVTDSTVIPTPLISFESRLYYLDS